MIDKCQLPNPIAKIPNTRWEVRSIIKEPQVSQRNKPKVVVPFLKNPSIAFRFLECVEWERSREKLKHVHHGEKPLIATTLEISLRIFLSGQIFQSPVISFNTAPENDKHDIFRGARLKGHQHKHFSTHHCQSMPVIPPSHRIVCHDNGQFSAVSIPSNPSESPLHHRCCTLMFHKQQIDKVPGSR